MDHIAKMKEIQVDLILIQTQVILSPECQFLLVQQAYLITKISRFRLLFRQLIQITTQQLSTFLLMAKKLKAAHLQLLTGTT